MRRRSFRFGMWVALVFGIGFAVWKSRSLRPVTEAGPEPVRGPWPPVARIPTPAEVPEPGPKAKPEPEPKLEAAPEMAAEPRAAVLWVTPSSPDLCPDTHPVKAKLSSGLFHLPGMLAYTRTKPDRCYGGEEDAITDGLTRAKR